MRKAWNVIVEVMADTFSCIAYFIKSNLVDFANILNFILPYLMYFIGQEVALTTGKVILLSGELLIPLLFISVIYFVKSCANKIGKGITVPCPEKRFTQVDEDGEVSIENNRIQELILYLADLEDWLEKKGLL